MSTPPHLSSNAPKLPGLAGRLAGVRRFARSHGVFVTKLSCALGMSLTLVSLAGSAPPRERPVAPKIWDDKALADWALPLAGVKATPHFYSEAEYYAAPAADLRTYPVYHPDREPSGYM